ncbi:MAG: choice-of-anchor M domain-containing protein [Chthoniobacteraceae bacterium]
MKTKVLHSLLSLALATGASAAVLRDGHTDLGIAYEDNKLFPHIHDEGDDIEYTPGAAVLLVKHAAYEAIPVGTDYDFLRPGGETHVWRLPKVEDPNLLFLGFGTEEIDPGVLVGDVVKIRLSALSGPVGGKFACYDVDSFGAPVAIFNSGDGISAADTYVIPIGGHQDLNWTFSQPGDYRVTFTITAKVGTVNKTATAVYKFHVQTAAEAAAPGVLVSRDGLALDIGGVVLTTLENADFTTGVLLVSFSGEDVTAANNTAIVQASATGVSTVLVREGDEPANLPGLKFSTLSSPVISAAGSLAFSGNLRLDGAVVTAANNAYLALKDGAATSVIAREGDTAAGQAAEWKWNTFGVRLISEDGILIFQASIIDRTPPAVRIRSGYWRRDAAGTILPLGVTGTVLTTEIGPKIVSSIGLPNPGTSRDQTRAFDQFGALNLLVGFTDRTASVVRFAAP